MKVFKLMAGMAVAASFSFCAQAAEKLNFKNGLYLKTTQSGWVIGTPEEGFVLQNTKADVIKIKDIYRKINYSIDPKLKSARAINPKFTDKAIFKDNIGAYLSRKYVNSARFRDAQLSKSGNSLSLKIEADIEIPTYVGGSITGVIEFDTLITVSQEEKWVPDLTKPKNRWGGYDSVHLKDAEVIKVSVLGVSVKDMKTPLGGSFDQALRISAEIVAAVAEVNMLGIMARNIELVRAIQ